MRNPISSCLFLMLICSLQRSFCIFEASGQCLGDQQSLLLQLKNNLVFSSDSSTKLVDWNRSADCCLWEGITCKEGRVIGLDLSLKSISGGLDNFSSLFDLQNLRNLSLAYNKFPYSQIPSVFDKLTNLSYLNLSHAGFAGQIPMAISRLTRLVTLDLSAFNFPGIIPLKLENPNLKMLVQNLPELIELHLDGVNISARGNEWCQALSSSLPNLRLLSLSNSYLSGPIDSTLLKLQHLSIIRLDTNNLSTPVPEFFANFTELTSLRLSFSGLIGKFPRNILQVPTLEILDLSNNELLHGSLPDFSQNGSLRTLVLSSTNFSGALSDSIGNLTKLSGIDLSNCNFNGSLPLSMAKLTQLLYLDISSNSFTGPIPSFSMAKNLTQINLSHNDLIGSITSTSWEELRNLVSLDLRRNSLNGSIPVSLFFHPFLQKLQLSNNQFSGQLNHFSNISSDLLDTLDLSSNKLEGPIPMSVFELRSLKILSLSSNKFNGSLPLLNVIQHLRILSSLDLSYNRLSIEYNGTSGINSPLSSSIPHINILNLASCKLKKFPDFLRNQSRLSYLDLSDNQIVGDIPNWISKLDNLLYLNLSFNYLVTLEGPLSNLSFLSVLDLRSNLLQGELPIPPPYATYLDFSRNNFSSVIPASIGDSLAFAYFFSLSSNKLKGSIPISMCNLSYLQVLDLSNNSFSGKIPQCLVEESMILGVLNLRRNKLNGSIPDSFPENCDLQTLNLNGNNIEGHLPKSLANCTKLEVMDIGHNLVEDSFPCFLKNTPMLRILVLRSNKFSGPIDCLKFNALWPRLQIVDVASNNFTGKLPKVSSLTAMMGDENEAQSKLDHLQFEVLRFNQFHFQDSMTITFKGLDMELVKILTIFTSFDFSYNNFEGPIPEEFGAFRSLYVLNLSHNALTGQIPQSLANLTQLESLDLSRNKLTGEIPMRLADGLIFLSVLNFSFNQLVGQIPQYKQFATFSEASYVGNKGLCGFPLKVECTHVEPISPPTFDESPSNFENMIDWNFISAELGFVFGFGIVIGPLMFCKRWRIWYSKRIDDIIFKIFP